MSQRRGEELRRQLEGCWRVDRGPVAPRPSPSLIETAIRLGVGALLSPGVGADRRAAVVDCHRHQALEEAIAEHQLAQVATTLAAAGIRPLLIKGLAVARHYPARGLRPACDIDLVIAADQLAAARALVPGGGRVHVDFHGDPRFLEDRVELRRRVRSIPVGSATVDVPAPEDLLRLVCLHLLIHGGWRPLWLCDVAVLVERGEPLDAEYLLSGDARRSRAVACVLGVARELLGVELPAPLARRGLAPRWLVRGVLEAWGADHRPYPPLRRLPLGPLALLREARRRWPNPVGATALFGGPYNELPRLPIQLAAFAVRVAQLLAASSNG